MKKISTSLLLITTSFAFGFAFKTFVDTDAKEKTGLKRVTGIGGIFFKCKDPKKLKTWYKDHLGLVTDQYGTNFVWYQGADSTKKASTQWTPFKDSSKYFGSPEQKFMINYRVADLEALVAALKKEGVMLADTMESYDYGKFIHIIDNEGNKVELWQPNDAVYDKYAGARTK